MLEKPSDSKPSVTVSEEECVVQSTDQSPELSSAEQSVKELSPPERAHTNLFGMLASSATFDDMTLAGFGGHRDTLATFRFQRVKHSTDLPIQAYERIAQLIDFETYNSVRLTCRCWSAAFTYVRPVRFPPIYFLPAEIVKCIFDHLSPLDLNAARHTCRKWMIASLEHRLLARVLNQAGFWTAVEADSALNAELGHPAGGEWRLSKRLATECSLIPGWTGNGFSGRLTTPSTFHTYSTLPDDQKPLTSMLLSSRINFTELVAHYQTLHYGSPAQLSYTVSGCGRFLLVVHGSIVWVYCIRCLTLPAPQYQHGGYIELLASIACPYNILAVSMDTSSDRYSIAALLSDRRGLVVDIPDLHLMTARSRQSSPHSEHDTLNMSHTWDVKASPDATPTTSQRVNNSPGFTDTCYASPAEVTPTSRQSSPTPLRLVPHTLYRNLCSKTSPPLTVAICPQRRCVAFGSSAGIELHWQDAGTGHELSRWMELVGPAEHIHFLPLRTDEVKALEQHLRLVSSRASPIGYHDPIEMDEAWRYEKCKFLRAVPLKDGKHVLYTDPSNADLYLGTGLHHPFGTPKPVKRFVLQGPQHSFEDQTLWPRCYKAATELRWGAKIAVGFGEQIWLFSIPPDWLDDDYQVQGSLQGIVERRKNGVIAVHGTQIGSISGLAELAIDASSGDLTIHAFSSCAPSQVYQIGRHPGRDVRKMYVSPDGRVLEQGTHASATQTPKHAPNSKEPTESGHDHGSIKYTQVTNLDRHALLINSQDQEDGEEIQMREFAVGDWVHDTEVEDEGYASDGEDGNARVSRGIGYRVWDDDDDEARGDGGEARGDEGVEDGWAEGGEEDGWPGDDWPVMELVRLEVEILCGG